jgi:hypothetical protein
MAMMPVTRRWFLTVLLSEYTSEFYQAVFSHDLTFRSIKNGLLLCSLITIIDR